MFLKETKETNEIINCLNEVDDSIDIPLDCDYKFYQILSDENIVVGYTYLETIDLKEGIGEFKIAVKDSFKTKGYAWFGMLETLNAVFNSTSIQTIYWRVKCDNKEALRFFRKHGFKEVGLDISNDIKSRIKNYDDYTWFVVLKGDDYSNAALSKKTIAGCKITKIKTIPTIGAGELSFFEGNHDINFDIKRIYYISKVPEGVRRGFHAHKNLKQILFCPYGKIQLILENKDVREEITLSDPSIGIVIDKPTWREMLWLEKDSVLVVGASDYYNVEDYIRNYEDFKKYINE